MADDTATIGEGMFLPRGLNEIPAEPLRALATYLLTRTI